MKECQHCKACYSDDVETCPTDGMPTIVTISGEPVLDGKYQMESRIGQGGMGVVYKGRHAYLKTQHAIKIILPDLVGNDPQLVTRFRQEALAAAAIRHQNVVQVTDYGVAQETMPFLVMEYVEGESLHDLLAREGRLAPEHAFELVSAICAGIGAAHKQGIVHRDMKPLNIMLLSEGTKLSEKVKILDFGLAKIKSGELLGSFIQAQTTGLMGSPYYMAPEQWSDEGLGPQSDIYSIGVMLYQMLAGDVPFKGSSIPAIMKKHLEDPPPTFAEKGVSIPPLVEATVFRTLVKDPTARIQTVEQLVSDFERALKGQPPSSADETELNVAPLRVLTNPPQSSVLLDKQPVGVSRNDGWLLLEGVQTGQHVLEVKRNGYKDWSGEIVCDGKPRQVVAELEPVNPSLSVAGIPMPDETLGVGSTQPPLVHTAADGTMSPTAVVQQTTGVPSEATGETSQPAAKKSGVSPVLLAGIGIFLLLGLTGLVAGTAYYLGAFDRLAAGEQEDQTGDTTPTQTPVSGGGDFRNELVRIEGGKFQMGLNDSLPQEGPEHEVTVGDFSIDKTEVTNGEYYSFVSETGYENLPVDWLQMGRRPVAGKEKFPVRSVNIADVKAFAAWRSKRDGKTYRLPTEAEWEYVARNGAESTLYPWGNKYRAECAVLGKLAATPEEVGSKECGASKRWGVQDLIGNVFEWTSSEAKPYPGNSGEYTNKTNTKLYMIRGGSAYRDPNGKKSETSTFRTPVAENLRDARLGFRLVTEQ